MNPNCRVRVDAEPNTQHRFGDVENVIRRDIVSADEETRGLEPAVARSRARAG